MGLVLSKIFQERVFATVILVVMTTQIVFIEGPDISVIKVGLMALMPVVFLLKVPYVSKALVWGLIYLLVITFSGIFHPESFRFFTVGYRAMFLVTFITLYNLIYLGAFSEKYFIKLVKWLILSYSICLICQQLFVLAGIRFMPFVNLNNQFFLSINKLPSLSLEPSHSARILGVLMYVYMKCNAHIQRTVFGFRQLFAREHKWVTIGFLWAMFTMGSGTAFIVLAVLSLYFINWKNALFVFPILVGFIYVGSLMGIEQLDRAYHVAQATLTLDNEIVIKTDHSASARIMPILNTIKGLDLTKKEHWFGYGIDAGLTGQEKQMLGEITDYGFLAYLVGLVMVFSCSIRFWSIPTIMFFIGIGGSTANVAYQWGILMLFMCLRYFDDNKRFNLSTNGQ